MRDFRSGPVGAIKLNGEVLVELRAVLYETRAERIEHIQGQPLRILRSLYHEGGHRGDQYDFRHPFGSVATYVARNLATAGRMAYERDVPQIERVDDGGKVISVAIHVVAGGGLPRSAVTSPVMRDHAEALLVEEQHLSVPRVRIQRPTVGEHDYRASSPVFKVDLRTVFAADRVHGLGSCRLSAAGKGSSIGLSVLTCSRARAGIRRFAATLARGAGHDEFSSVKACEAKQMRFAALSVGGPCRSLEMPRPH